jgi:hypothetical protein
MIGITQGASPWRTLLIQALSHQVFLSDVEEEEEPTDVGFRRHRVWLF